MKRLAVIMLACATGAVAFGDVQGTITTENGGAQKGTIRWSSRDKAYVLTRGGVDLQVKALEVTDLDIDKPASFDAAVAQVQKGQGAAAIPALKKIVSDYAHLKWDKIAGRYLADAYLAGGKAEEALKACQAIISSEPSAAYRGELAPAYWGSLLALGRKPQLESALAKAAKSGDRFSSGSALIMRGDVIFKDGKESNDAAKQALTDGYLRVVLMYRDVPDIQPEALYKASQCFEKLGQTGRAESMRAELKQRFAASPWAAK